MGLKARSGRWHYRFILDGKQYSATTGLAATERNRKTAEQQEYEFRKAIVEGRTPPKVVRARLFSDAAEEFTEWAKSANPEHPNTAKRLWVSFQSLAEFFRGRMVMAIDAGAVEEYMTWRRTEHRVREVTLRHDYFALSSFYRWAMRKRYARENPVRQVKAPSDARAVRIHVLTQAEEKAYFAAALAHRSLYDMARLMLNQGCRPGELLRLRKSDCDLMVGRMRIREGKSAAARRTLKLTAESISILAARVCLSESPWVFPTRKGHLKSVQNTHDAVLEKTGLRFVLYDLRHTFATRMAALGCPLATLAQILGHAPGSIRVIMRYVHPTVSEMDSFMVEYEQRLSEKKNLPS